MRRILGASQDRQRLKMICVISLSLGVSLPHPSQDVQPNAIGYANAEVFVGESKGGRRDVV